MKSRDLSLVIREQIHQNVPGIRETLGVPTGEPAPIDPMAVCQRLQNGVMLGTRPPATYAILNDGGFLSFR